MKRKEDIPDRAVLKFRLIMERLDKVLTLISEIQAPINSSISPNKGKNKKIIHMANFKSCL